MKLVLLRILFVLLIIAVITLFTFEYINDGFVSTKNLLRGCLIILGCVISLIRTFQANRKTLQFYERQYADILEHAFIDQSIWRKKLLCAVRLYDENRCRKALKYLMDLKHRAQSYRDHFAIDLFAALCYTDLSLYDQAIHIYQQIISKGNANSRIFSNLGHVLMKTGDYKNALRNYNLALDYDRDNAFAYNNIAHAHFQLYEFEEAIPYAKKSLEINSKMHQASTLLTIIYALLHDNENAEKYFHIAISSGRNPQQLKELIEYFRTAQQTMDKEMNITE